MLNKSEREQPVEVQITSKKNGDGKMFLYQVTRPVLVNGDFKLDPRNSFSVTQDKSIKILLPPKSISTLTQFELYHNDFGIFE
jgi:hypothetical protein